MIEIAGVVAIDEDDDTVWGIGATEDEANEQAWRMLSVDKPEYGAALDYHEATPAVLEWVRKKGGEDVPVKRFRHEGRVCIALVDEVVETRCPLTGDLFKQQAQGAKG